MAIPTVQITGTILTPAGDPVRDGTVSAELSQSGRVIEDNGLAQSIAGETSWDLAPGGALPADFALIPNDVISPAGTVYIVTFNVTLQNYRPFSWVERWKLHSAPATIAIGDVLRVAQASSAFFVAGPGGATGPQGAPGAPGSPTTPFVATGTTTARNAPDRAADFLSVLDFGAACDGTTDDTAAFNAAIAAAMTSGKELRIPERTCLILGQLWLPNDGATPPKQKPLRIVGTGPTWSGRGAQAANGGSVLDMRYSGAYGKLLTTGLGLLEVAGLTFVDGAGTTTPWIYTTNTTLNVHGNSFIGSKNNLLCDQDAIILGGTVGVEGQGDPSHGFQGYGTTIWGNYFNRVRRAVYGRTFCNATVVRDNTVWSSSGSNLAGGAAIEFDSVGGQTATGNNITGNLIEATYYAYGVKLGSASQNVIVGNSCYDAVGNTLASVRLESAAAYNFVIPGFIAPGVPPVSDATTGSVNTVIPVGQTQNMILGQGGTLTFNATDVVHQNGGNYPFAHYKNLTSSDEFYLKSGGSGIIALCTKYQGGAEETFATFRRYGVDQYALQINGATFNGVESTGTDLKLRAKSGAAVYLGDTASQPAYVLGSTKLFRHNGRAYIGLGNATNEAPLEVRAAASQTADMVQHTNSGGTVLSGVDVAGCYYLGTGTSLVKWCSGSGSPEGVVTANPGSLYTSTGGGATTTLYVKTSGTGNTGWTAK